MKVRKVSPFLLLLAPSLVRSATHDIPSQWQPLLRKRDGSSLQARQEAELPLDQAGAVKNVPGSRSWRGTEDAPVDGLDGKPHAGPFVDMTPDEVDRDASNAPPESLAKFASSADERWRLEDIPERNDGVMNDDTRVAPKKGTTGTEGGISEKERLRKEAGATSTSNTPQEPKAAPPQQLIEADFDESADSSQKSSTYLTGFERPEDLPDRPHDIPFPDRVGSKSTRDSEEPPVDGTNNGWLKDTMPYTEGKTNPKPPQSARTNPTTKAPLLTNLLSDDSESWHEWFHSFVLSLTMILFSEIGDKTFLVAALMAMRHSQLLVFSAAFSALTVMTVLSALLGHVFPTLLPKRLTTLAAAILFLIFGAKMLREGLAMPRDAGVGEEMQEVEAELEEKEHSMQAHDRASSRRRSSAAGGTSPYALEAGRGRSSTNNNHQTHTIKIPGANGAGPSPPLSRSPSPSGARKPSLSGLMNLCSLVLSPAWVQTFIMTFLGEWGDRSQIATIAMAAGQNVVNVTLGALLGHACCTGLAVVGGRALAGKVSLRVVTIGGAVAFLAFGVIYLYECATE